MFRLLRSLGYVCVAAVLARLVAPGSDMLAPWLPTAGVAVVGVAFGLERLDATEGWARYAPVGLAAGVVTGLAVLLVYGVPVVSFPMLLAGVAAAAVAVPLAGLAIEAFPGTDGRAHVASGVIGVCALLPLGVYFLPWWVHPLTHWNPLFWVQHTFFRAFLMPAELEATGIRQPATWDWEYPLVPFIEAAAYGWFLTRRIREQRKLAAFRDDQAGGATAN